MSAFQPEPTPGAGAICGVTLDPFDVAQETAGSRGMDIDVIGAPISQSTIQQPFYIGAVANVPEIV